MISQEIIDKVKQKTAEIIPETDLLKKLKKSADQGKPLRIKYGIDPTGTDVHIGHLVPIRKMREFQDLGHTGVIIIGDFTARIGDPTGRDITRPSLSAEQVKANAGRYMDQLYLVLDKQRTEVRYQSEWFEGMSLSDMLNLLSKFTLAQFLAHDTFRKRYEQGLALAMHEIMYPVLQGYDSIAVNADIELGATEQKFNILVGRDMQRFYGREEQVAMLFPILTGTDGVSKMSKSLNNYIALFDTAKDKYGKVMSIPDNLILSYFELATPLNSKDIEKIKEELDKGVNPKIIKQNLARLIVELYHDKDTALAAEQQFNKVFAAKEMPDEIEEYRVTERKLWIIKLLKDSGMCKSSSEARRMIKQKAVSIDKETITDENYEVEIKDGIILRVGKKRFMKIRKEDG